MDGIRREAAGRQMRLKTADTITADGGGVERAGRQLEAISDTQLDVAAKIGKMEGDRTALGDEDLVIGMAVRGVAVARGVAPAAG